MVHTCMNGSGLAVLHLASRRELDATCLKLGGELDLATADHLVNSCRQLVPPAGGLLRLELADLQFLDAAGLRALLHVHQLMTDRGHRLQVHQPRPLARRMLALTGLDTVLDVHEGPGDIGVPDGRRSVADDPLAAEHPVTG